MLRFRRMSINVKPPVAVNLRILKDARRGVTWQAIAQSLGVSERLVNAWASEEDNDPSWFNICRLAEFFGVEPCLLYMNSDLVKSIVTADEPFNLSSSNFYVEPEPAAA